MMTRNQANRLGIHSGPRNERRSTGRRRLGTALIGLTAIAGLLAGCSRDPLALARDRKKISSDGWKLVDRQGAGDIAVLAIQAKDPIAAPDGTRMPSLWLHCGGLNTVTLVPGTTLENADVKIAFDSAAPVTQTWTDASSRLKTLDVPAQLRHDLVVRLTESTTFNVAVTPKGGKPQNVSFTLFNLRELVHLEKSCASLLSEPANSASNGQQWTAIRYQVDGQDRTIFSLKAGQAIQVDGKDDTAQINISCGKGSQTYISAPPSVNQNPYVSLIFDQRAPVREKWHWGSGSFAPSSLDAQRLFLTRLLAAKTFKFEYTPKNALPQSSTFELLDLKEQFNHEKPCESWVHPEY